VLTFFLDLTLYISNLRNQIKVVLDTSGKPFLHATPSLTKNIDLVCNDAVCESTKKPPRQLDYSTH